MTNPMPSRSSSSATSASMRAAVTSIDGTDSASSTTPVTPSRCAAVRIRLRTQSAFAKNRPKRRIATPSGDTFSGWRAMSPYWSGVPGTLPMCAT
jgi:hypothetical protein